MAGTATGNVAYAAHAILLLQVVTKIDLIRELLSVYHHRMSVCRLLVRHVKYEVAWTQLLFRLAMTVQAELHLHRRFRIHQRHAIHRSMAGLAAHALVDVNAVVEINVVGYGVHACPLD